MKRQTIRVFYPNERGAVLRLRTEENWDLDIEPVSVSAMVSEFSVPTSRVWISRQFDRTRHGGSETAHQNLS